MRRKTLFAVFLALAVLPALGVPCRAQDNPADTPVLKRYAGRDWIYFASAGDGALIFENRPGDASNVWVAAERSPLNRRILTKTDIWTDSRGRLHTVNVLKVQMEFNDYVEEARSPLATKVSETGILDCQTLAIPNTKLYVRARKISDRLEAEDAAIKRLENTDANGVITKKRFASYLWEKVWVATALLNELNRTVFFDVPQSTADEEGHRPGCCGKLKSVTSG